MWTVENRARYDRGKVRYPTDLTDAEWEHIKPLLPRPAERGRARKVDLREILNALRYMARSGGGWRRLPVHFGPWETVYWWFRRLMRRLLFRTVHDVDVTGWLWTGLIERISQDRRSRRYGEVRRRTRSRWCSSCARSRCRQPKARVRREHARRWKFLSRATTAGARNMAVRRPIRPSR